MSTVAQLAEMQSRLVAQSNKMKGYIQKKSGNLLVGFQSRYFLIVDHFLAYFKDQSLAELKGKINICNMKEVAKIGNDCFTVDIGDRVYTLRVTDQIIRDDWVSCLNILKEYYQMGRQLSKESKFLYYSKWKQLMGSQRHRIITPEAESESDRIYRAVLKQLSLNLLSQDYSTPAIKSRLLIQKFKEGFYFCVSCKSLFAELDDEMILPKEYIQPYDFNVLYAYQRDINEARPIFSTDKITSVYVVDNKYLKINLLLLTIEQDNNEFVEGIKTSVAIGKEYHNQLGVRLNRNIDVTLSTYDTTKTSFDKIEKLNTKFEIQYSEIINECDKSYRKQYTIFNKLLERLLAELTDFMNACKVKTPQRIDIMRLYLEFMHDKIYKLLRTFWNQNHESLSNQNILKLAKWVFSYTKILKGHVRDERPATGVKILLDIYFRNANNEIIELIKQIYNNKRFYELTVAHCTKLPFEFCNFIQVRIGILQECFDLKDIADSVEILLKTAITAVGECISEIIYNERNIQLLSALCNDVLVYKKNTSIIKHISITVIDKITQKMHSQIIKRIVLLLIKPINTNDPVEYCREAIQMSKSPSDIHNSGLQQLQLCTVRILGSIYLTSILIRRPSPDKILEQIAKDYPRLQKLVSEQGIQFQPLLRSIQCIQMIIRNESDCKVLQVCLKLKESVDQLSGSDIQELLRLSKGAGTFDSDKIIERIFEGKERCISETQSKASDIFKSYHPRSLEHQHCTAPRQSTLTMSLSGNTKCQLEGYLQLKDQSKDYKQRFFRYTDHCLKWYHSAMSHQLINMIELSQIVKVHAKSKHDKFEIEKKDGTVLKLKANSEISAAKWAEQLNKLLFMAQHSYLLLKQDKSTSNEQLFKDYFTASEGNTITEPIDQRLLPIMSKVTSQQSRQDTTKMNFKKSKQIEEQKLKPQEKKRGWFRWGCLGFE